MQDAQVRGADPAGGGAQHPPSENPVSVANDIPVPDLPVENHPSFESSIHVLNEAVAIANSNYLATQQQQATGVMVPPASTLAAGGATAAAAAARPPQRKIPALSKKNKNSTQAKRKASDHQESSSTSSPVSKKSKTATPAAANISPYTKKDVDPYLVWYPQLVKFKQENGHLDVSSHEMPGLFKFTFDCKRAYGRIQEGKTSDLLTPERITQLNELGFSWSFRGGKVRKSDPRWEKKFAQLVAFQKEHGHCRVAARQNETLARFVVSIRSNYRDLQRTQKSTLTPERLQRLESIGFEFPNEKTSKNRHKQKDARSWDEHFLALQDFKKSHGHTVVPPSFDKDLNHWVVIQRKYYRNYMDIIRADNERKLAARDDPEGKGADELEKQYKQTAKPEPARITAEQIVLLHMIDFDFVVVKETPEEAWDIQYKALIEFKEKHGHTRVSRNDQGNLKLANWVQHQRRYRVMKLQGNPKLGGSLPDERIRLLDEIGFEWRVKPRAIDRCVSSDGEYSDDDYDE